MSITLEPYIELLSKAFLLDTTHVQLNTTIQTTAAKHLKDLWVLDGLFNCLNLILVGKQEVSNLEVTQSLTYLSEYVDDILNTGHYAEVEDKYRLLYSLVCLVRAFNFCILDDAEKALNTCDDGLLKGLELEGDLLAEMAELLCEKLGPIDPIKVCYLYLQV
jgi:hypothetical protein